MVDAHGGLRNRLRGYGEDDIPIVAGVKGREVVRLAALPQGGSAEEFAALWGELRVRGGAWEASILALRRSSCVVFENSGMGLVAAVGEGVGVCEDLLELVLPAINGSQRVPERNGGYLSILQFVSARQLFFWILIGSGAARTKLATSQPRLWVGDGVVGVGVHAVV